MPNQYEYTRAIKFILDSKDENNTLGIDMTDHDRKDITTAFQDFKISYANLLINFENAIFIKGGRGNHWVNPRLEVKYPWLRRYAREEFYATRRNDKQLKKYTIVEAKFLEGIFNSWIERNNSLKEELDEAFFRQNKAKYSDIALLMRQLQGADYFFFVRDLLGYVNNKDLNTNINELQNSVTKIEKLIEKINSLLVPNQGQGIEVARGSFNYYSINKISKNFEKTLKARGQSRT